ncbi:MAG: hypothetical protein IT547_05705 [Hyphomonadaceae bacterium]|nr:hypothetical protein [Hyphomonadaceae bacterium]
MIGATTTRCLAYGVFMSRWLQTTASFSRAKNRLCMQSLVACALALSLLAACSGKPQLTIDAVCGAPAPSARYFEWMHSRPRGAGVSDIALQSREIDLNAARSWYSHEQLDCFAGRGDQLAILVVASDLHSNGEDARAEALLRQTLPPVGTPLETGSNCWDSHLPTFLTCDAGLPENWLLLGDMILARARSMSDIEEAEAAFQRAHDLDPGLNEIYGRLHQVAQRRGEWRDTQ